MMGMAQYTADIPVAKGTGAILAFCENEEQTVEHPQCIRCGKCIRACPTEAIRFRYGFGLNRNTNPKLVSNHQNQTEES